MGSKEEIHFKLVLLGESAVGKSSMVLRFEREAFVENNETTVGAAFFTKSSIVDNRAIKYEIWDTAGQERYHTLAPMYYRGAQAAIVVYDITKEDTFERAKNWIIELNKQASQDIVIALCGNKLDLEEEREIEERTAALYAQEQNIIFMETSSKTNTNITEVFFEIARKIPTPKKRSIKKNKAVVTNPNSNNLKKSMGGCCNKS